MSKNELELIETIRGHADPEEALLIAVQVITSFLELLGSSE